MAYKKLIYDTAATGHHSEYLGHLVDYLYVNNVYDAKYFFVVHPEFASLFSDIYEKGKKTPCITWVPVQDFELKKIEEGNAIIASIRSMNVMTSYAKKFEVNHVVALDFHTIKYGAIYKRIPYELSSILFLQFYRLKRDTLKEKIEFYKRYFLMKLSSRNQKVKKIFVLNDQETADYMNREFHTNCFRMLPDPIPQLVPLPQFNIYNQYQIEAQRKIFLHIGALGNRKGTQEVIDSAFHLDENTQKNVAILLVGKTGNSNDEKAYIELINQVNKKTNVQMMWDNQFVSNKMMKSLFDQCDTVLLPYKNAEFSSGILGHAAAAHKRVIATNAGLIRELVLKYRLGALLDEPNAIHLAEKIKEILEMKLELTGQNKFVDEHRPEVFAEIVLTS